MNPWSDANASILPDSGEAMGGRHKSPRCSRRARPPGLAGNWDFISWLVSELENATSGPGVRFFTASILGASCHLQAVRPLLRLHSLANDEYERIPIENALLYLLEDHQDAENGWEAGESTAVGNENDDA